MTQAYVNVPSGWSRGPTKGLGPFVSREVLTRPDGTLVVWESRWHRKHPRRAAGAGSTWWAPRAIAWWIGPLFAIGSACFALGALPVYADAVGTNADNLTYFIGSIFFTTAAFLQYYEAATTNPLVSLDDDRAPGRRLRQLVEAQPGRIDWWASLVQLVGTLWFNRTTSERVRGRPGRFAHAPPGVATGRAGIDLLPRRELARLGGDLSRALRLAAR